jgi:hypothetical protein
MQYLPPSHYNSPRDLSGALNMVSDSSKRLLNQFGWTPDRNIDIQKWQAQLECEGFVVTQEAAAILRSFGGLTINLSQAEGPFIPEWLTFDPIIAASGEFDRIDYWQKYLGSILTPLALVGGGAIMVISAEGRVYSCWTGVLFEHGRTFEDALLNVHLLGKRLPTEIAHSMEY